MKKILLLILLGFATLAQAEDFAPFTIEDIQIEGLQRNTTGMVLGTLNIGVGDVMNQKAAQQVIRSLFATGYFYDVYLSRKGNVLVIHVKEQPVIAKVNIKGSKAVSEETLRDSLKKLELAEGFIFKRTVLSRAENEIRSQYHQKGKYGVNVITIVTPLERNRVEIDIEVREGPTTHIQKVNIVGNRAFGEDELLAIMRSKAITRTLTSSGHKYSKEKLEGDIEILRSWYLDHGYIEFKVVSTQVTITPDMSEMYITINIDEGAQYTLGEIRINNQSELSDEEIRRLINLQSGELFSRQRIYMAVNAISTRLGDDGFAFPSINPEPIMDKNKKVVSFVFHIIPGSRYYVRRVEIRGNKKTRDDVIRREVRQQEGGLLSMQNLRLTHERLSRLGYFNQVSIETPLVPGSDDQVDVVITVDEASTGMISGGIGYSEAEGMSIQFGLTQDNFMGTGTYNNFNINTSPINTTFIYGNRDPYFTNSGISRNFEINYAKTDTSQTDIADYLLDRQGFTYGFGFPVNEYNRATLNIGFEYVLVTATATTPVEITPYLDTPYLSYYINATWVRDTRNNLLFPTSGSKNQLTFKMTTPGSDWQYFKVGLLHKSYFPMGEQKNIATLARINTARPYGGGGTGNYVPFFENYYSGGFESIRGFYGNSIGPQTGTSEPLGGALDIYLSLEYIFPFNKQENLRAGTFIDVGNIWATTAQFDPAEFRASVGIGILWLTPIGTLKFSYAEPIRYQAGDVIQKIQFNIGLPY